jgi:hypothetical protein
MNLKTTRDSVQIEANDAVLVETSGLDEALKVCLCYFICPYFVDSLGRK